jgi:hypothetical protein
MTDDDARRMIAGWRERAAFFQRVIASSGRSKCHEPQRALRRGMAAMAAMCADELEATLTDGQQDTHHASSNRKRA